MKFNPTNGNVSTYIPNTLTVTGKLPNSNSAQVFKFDISPDGTRLVAVGNFTHVVGQARPRVFMLDLGPTAATLSPWNYYAFGLSCSSTRPTSSPGVQDVDFAPDSSYFAVAAFGYMYQNGQRGFQPCDAVARFETNILSPTESDVDQLHRGRLAEVGGRDGGSGLRPGAQPLAGQPVRPGLRRTGCPGSGRRRRRRPRHGTGIAVEPEDAPASGGYQIVPTATGVWFANDGTFFRR